VANAFFKPGPATGGMAQAFIRRYRGEERVSYLHPTLEPILAPTKGVLLFQEQILRVATEIAGLSWEEANQLRRGISKFQAHEMESLQTQFIAGCTRPSPSGPGFTSSQANTLWEQVLAFAGYGFNQGHATAYADVSYRSAYLKLHWPAAFFCARLAEQGGFHHPAVYSAEAVRLGIPIHPPHVNHSLKSFTLTFTSEPPTSSDQPSSSRPRPVLRSSNQRPVTSDQQPILWMGLGQVRGLRRNSIAEIMRQRKDGPYNRLDDLLERVSLQTKEVIHLIQCGALEGLGRSRAALLAQAEAYQRAGSTKQMAFSFAGELDSPAESLNQRMRWEKDILGRPVSVHPLDLLEQRPAETVQLLDLPGTQGQEVTVTGVRLPGWTGGPGFFLADQKTFIIARGDKSLKPPEPWSPVLVRGRWTSDEWGTSWLQVERLRPL
jgi:DNA polymerase III alpha subunit